MSLLLNCLLYLFSGFINLLRCSIDFLGCLWCRLFSYLIVLLGCLIYWFCLFSSLLRCIFISFLYCFISLLNWLSILLGLFIGNLCYIICFLSCLISLGSSFIYLRCSLWSFLIFFIYYVSSLINLFSCLSRSFAWLSFLIYSLSYFLFLFRIT